MDRTNGSWPFFIHFDPLSSIRNFLLPMPTAPFDSDTSHQSYDFDTYKANTKKHSCGTSINSLIRIGETSVGKGVFARRHIHEGLLLSEIHVKSARRLPRRLQLLHGSSERKTPGTHRSPTFPEPQLRSEL